MKTYPHMNRLGYTRLQARVGAGLPPLFGLGAFGAVAKRAAPRPNAARDVAKAKMGSAVAKPAAAKPVLKTAPATPAPRPVATAQPAITVKKAPGLTGGAASAVPTGLSASARLGVSPSSALATYAAPTHLSIELKNDAPYNTPSYGPLVGPRPPAVVQVLTGVSGLGSTDGFLDSITGALKSVVPQNTIVGKLLGGDVSGAVQGTVKEIAKQNVSAAPPATITPQQVELAYPGQVLVPQNSAQKWMLAGAAVLGAGLLYMILRRRRQAMA